MLGGMKIGEQLKLKTATLSWVRAAKIEFFKSTSVPMFTFGAKLIGVYMLLRIEDPVVPKS